MSNFHPLEVVDRGSETQLRVGENLKRITDKGFWGSETVKQGLSHIMPAHSPQE